MYQDAYPQTVNECVTPDPDHSGYFCSQCADFLNHPGGQTRYIGGEPITESEVSITVNMVLEDGSGQLPAPGTGGLTLCEAHYRGYVAAPYEGKKADELIPCGGLSQEFTFGGWWDCWQAKLTIITDASTGTNRPMIIGEFFMGQVTILENLGYTPDPPGPIPNPQTGDPWPSSSVYSAEYRGIGNPLGNDINGNQYCGTCDLPESALENLALFSGGDVYPGPPPGPTGIDNMTQHGSFNIEYCGTPNPPYETLCEVEIDYPTWPVLWWHRSIINNYCGGGRNSPAMMIGNMGGCQGDWFGQNDPPRVGSWCTSTLNASIHDPGDCVFPVPPIPPYNIECLAHQDPDSECVGVDVTVWHVWTGQRYLNVSFSI
jgi:hypothetical protein